jgi:hypothetical protein
VADLGDVTTRVGCAFDAQPLSDARVWRGRVQREIVPAVLAEALRGGAHKDAVEIIRQPQSGLEGRGPGIFAASRGNGFRLPEPFRELAPLLGGSHRDEPVIGEVVGRYELDQTRTALRFQISQGRGSRRSRTRSRMSVKSCPRYEPATAPLGGARSADAALQERVFDLKAP